MEVEKPRVELYGMDIAVSQTVAYCPDHDGLYQSNYQSGAPITFIGDTAFVKRSCPKCKPREKQHENN